ncbi:hypothetical protein ACWIG5_06750 [Streptomyces lydicus]|uniref:hypothetical protein n=1 Tax=Streptomyces lydicus TaxID=47763 RepID=UPI00368ADCF5
MKESPDPAVELVATDPVEKTRELKSADGKDSWLLGGSELAGALYPEIDQLIIKHSPSPPAPASPSSPPPSPSPPRLGTDRTHGPAERRGLPAV